MDNAPDHVFKIVVGDRTFHAIASTAQVAQQLVEVNFPEVIGEIIVSEIEQLPEGPDAKSV